eukprot:UN16797
MNYANGNKNFFQIIFKILILKMMIMTRDIWWVRPRRLVIKK